MIMRLNPKFIFLFLLLSILALSGCDSNDDSKLIEVDWYVLGATSRSNPSCYQIAEYFGVNLSVPKESVKDGDYGAHFSSDMFCSYPDFNSFTHWEKIEIDPINYIAIHSNGNLRIRKDLKVGQNMKEHVMPIIYQLKKK